jgi:hypothetical protein
VLVSQQKRADMDTLSIQRSQHKKEKRPFLLSTLPRPLETLRPEILKLQTQSARHNKLVRSDCEHPKRRRQADLKDTSLKLLTNRMRRKVLQGPFLLSAVAEQGAEKKLQSSKKPDPPRSATTGFRGVEPHAVTHGWGRSPNCRHRNSFKRGPYLV